MRPLAGLLALAVVGIAPLTAPAAPIAVLAAAGAMACALGIWRGSVRWLSLGAGLGVLAYALALWLLSAPLDPGGAVGLGVAVMLLLDVGEFDARLRGVAVDPRAAWRQARSWLASGAAAAAATLGVAAAAGGLARALPGWARPVALLAVLVAAGAAHRALWPGRRIARG